MSSTLSPELALGAFGPAVGLSCRECGHQYELGPRYACDECFGPVEVAYDFGAVTRESIKAGPKSMWRYAALLPVPANIAETRQLARRLDQELSKLPDGQRVAFELVRIDGLSMADAAEVVGTSVNAIKLRAHRAYEALRAVLNSEVGPS